MTGNAFAKHWREFNVVVFHQTSQNRTVPTGAPSKNQSNHGTLETLHRPAGHLMQLIVRNTEGVGQIRTIKITAQLQIENGTILGRQTFRRIPYQLGELICFGQTDRRTVCGSHIGSQIHRVSSHRTTPTFGAGKALVTSNGKQPGSHPIWFSKLRQLFDGPNKDVLRDIGSIGRVVQKLDAEAVNLAGESIVERGKSSTVARCCLPCQRSVA